MELMAQAEVERLGVRYTGRRRTSEVDDLSRKQRSGTRIFTGKREPVAQSEVAELMTRVEAESQEEDGKGGVDTRRKEGKKA
jgi:hypothetical protein